jgi:methylaspartate ammonia-lyase
MKIKDVLFVPGRSGWFNRDRAAMLAGAEADGFVYRGKPVTPGYSSIVQPGTVISVILVLEDGLVGIGDCADVNLSGFAGRDPLFRADEHLPFLRAKMRPFLIGRTLDRFRELAAELDKYVLDGQRLHTALRYGLTQAVLDGVALARRLTIAEVVAEEYGCEISRRPIPILASCQKGDWLQLDRMILKRPELLPHAGASLVERDLGHDGEKLLDYARRLSARIREIGGADYRPTLHMDLYGTIAQLFAGNTAAIARYLGRVKAAVAPFKLLIETPIIAATRDAQIEQFGSLRDALRSQGHDVPLIVDEWCNTLDDIKAFAEAGAADYVQIKTPDLGGVGNTIEAALFCARQGIGCCIGGTANETDRSTRVTTHIALACRPAFILSKPGLGGDEALMIQSNEMARTLALVEMHAVGG